MEMYTVYNLLFLQFFSLPESNKYRLTQLHISYILGSRKKQTPRCCGDIWGRIWHPIRKWWVTCKKPGGLLFLVTLPKKAISSKGKLFQKGGIVTPLEWIAFFINPNQKGKRRMKTYLISYDLNKEGAAYTKAKEQMEKAIKSLGEAIHVVTTTWAVKTNYPSARVQEILKSSIDNNDRFIFTQVCTDWNAWLDKDKIPWLQSAPKCCR